MKTKSFFSVAILATLLFTACGEEPNPNGNGDNNGNDTIPTKEGGAVINGICWAKCNVGETGTFVSNPQDYGGYYQWNRKDTANFLLFNDYYASDFPSVTSWLTTNDPCPTGWRIPTSDELKTLLDTEKVDTEWTTENGINGKQFIDKTTDNIIFLPAAGLQNLNNGKLEWLGKSGDYWSGTQSDYNFDAYALSFGPYNEIGGGNNKAWGQPVRCVAE